MDEAEAKSLLGQKTGRCEKICGNTSASDDERMRPSALQKDITEAIRVARKLYPDIEFIHSDFKTYVKAMEKEISENFSTVKAS